MTDFQSKRKTPNQIAFNRGERVFGGDAKILATRKPQLTFQYLRHGLGRNMTHPDKELLDGFYLPYKFITDERTGGNVFMIYIQKVWLYKQQNIIYTHI